MGAVILTDAKTAEGLVTLTVNECNRVPLGDLLLKKKDAKALFTLVVDDLLLDGPVPMVLSAVADLGTGGLRGSITPSTIGIENGQANTNLTLEVNRAVRDARTGRESLRGMPLKLVGGVVLSNLELKDFTVDFSRELVRGDMAKVFPNGAVLPLKGTANKPQLDVEKAIRDNAVKGLLGNIPGAQQDTKQGQQNQQQPDDPLGGFLKGITGQGNQQQPRQPNPPNRNRQP
jgi:hypothetical protein